MQCKNSLVWIAVLALCPLPASLRAAEQPSSPPAKPAENAPKAAADGEEEEPPLVIKVYHVPLASLRVALPKPYSDENLPAINPGTAGIDLGGLGPDGGRGAKEAASSNAAPSGGQPLLIDSTRQQRIDAAKQSKDKEALAEARKPNSEAQECVEALMDIIKGEVAPTSWDDTGGAGTITYYNGMFIVNQTEAVHHELEKLLPELLPATSLPMMTVDAYWLLLDSSQLQTLMGRNKGSDAATRSTVDPKALEELARSAPGYRGQITCFSGQTVYIAAGERRTVVLGAIPVVGDRAIAYQNLTAMPNIGAVLQVTPSVLPGKDRGLIDVNSLVTGWTDKATGSKAAEGEIAESSPQVDRLRMPTQQLATTLRVPLGRPVLVGGVTLNPSPLQSGESKEEQKKQLYLVVTTAVCAE